jgi:hypothetical protein
MVGLIDEHYSTKNIEGCCSVAENSKFIVRCLFFSFENAGSVIRKFLLSRRNVLIKKGTFVA